ncbi:MAG: hypothetical protein LUD15_01230 [Bacteroides sp.]|nr:hypothetical protein [Bacteroides sp.]
MKMVNGKNLNLSPFNFSTSVGNILCDNGIIHPVTAVVEPAMNILEFLESVKGHYLQVDTLLFHSGSIMDMEKSIQTSVDPVTSLPVYDTL